MIWMRANIAIMFLVTLFLFSACQKPEGKIIGTWKAVSTEEDIYFTFGTNNELSVNNKIFMKYSIVDGQRIILGEEEPVPFSLKGNTLRILHGTMIFTYKRVRFAAK